MAPATTIQVFIIILGATLHLMSGESCDITDTVTSQNDADFNALLPYYPGRYASNQEGVELLFHYLYSDNDIDLVIIMDRSIDTDRSFFYLRQKKLVRDLLWYYTNLSVGQTHVALITYATDTTVIYNGLTGSQLSRDDMFRQGGPWDRVTYDADPNASGECNVHLAFQKASELFATSARSNQAKRFLVTVSSGCHQGYPSEEMTALQGQNVLMFSVSLGLNKNSAKVRDLASSEEYFGEDTTWLDRIWHMRPGRGLIHECSTEPCLNGGWCVITGLEGLACRCLWGYKGYRCEIEENECEADACDATGYCIDGPATYDCGCFDDSCGCYCGLSRVDGVCPTGSWVTWWSILLLIIGSLCFILIIVIITLILMLSYRNREAKKRGQSSDIHRPSTVRELYQVVRFGHADQGPSGSDETEGPCPERETPKAVVVGKNVPGVTSKNGDVYSIPHANRSPVPNKKLLSPIALHDNYTESPILPTKRRSSALANAISVACEIARRPKKTSTVRRKGSKGTAVKKRSPISRDDIMHTTMETPHTNDIYKEIIGSRNDTTSCADVTQQHPLASNHIPAPGSAIDALSKHMAKAAPPNRPIAEIKPVLKDITSAKAKLKCPVPPAELCSSGYGSLDDLSVCYSEFTEGSDEEYENVCEQKNMESWLTYINDVIRRDGLENVCVVHRTDKQWVTSHRAFLPSKQEMSAVINVLDSGVKGDKFTFKSKDYVLEEADDQEFCAVQSGGLSLLCGVGSDSYIVLASHDGISESFKMLCKANIKYIRQHL